MAQIIQSEEAWPVVNVRIVGEMDEDNVRDWLPNFLGIADRKKPYAVIMDFSAATAPEARLATSISSVVHPFRDNLRRYQACVAMVITSKPVRVALNALILLIRPPSPVRVFESMADAEQFCRDSLKGGSQAHAAGA